MEGKVLEGWTDKEIKGAIRKAFGDIIITSDNIIKLLKQVFEKLGDSM